MYPALPSAWDPLRYQVDLPFRRRYFPLGFALDIETNSRDVLAAAGQSWPDAQAAFPDPPLRLRVIVSEEAAAGDPPDPGFRAQDHLIVLAADSRHFGACDLSAGFASVWAPASTVSRQRHFRFHYLESFAYMYLTHHYLASVHGGCVALDGRGAVLCGPPGAGKSCLAFACARQGLTFVSDDATYLLRRSRGRILLGRPHYLRFKESAPALLPELRSHPPGIDVNGERLIEVRADRLPGLQTGATCRAQCVLFLERQEAGPPQLIPLPAGDAVERIVREAPRYGDSVHQEQIEAVRRLADVGAFRLCYSGLEGAVRQVRGLLESSHPEHGDLS